MTNRDSRSFSSAPFSSAPFSLAPFSLAAYQALIGTLRDQGYEVRSFATAAPSERHLILRHDVDMSLSAALEMAQIETEINAASTYFILLRSEFYNPWTPQSLGAIKRIEDLGHNIGLHFDAHLYPGGDLDQAAAQEIEHLEILLAHPIEMVSFHRPAPQLINTNAMIAGHAHTYQSRFMTDIGYCSDSRGAWHFGHPLDCEAVQNGQALQLLTHPVWWTVAGQNPQEKLAKFLKDQALLLDHELAQQCSVHTRSAVSGHNG